MTLQTAHEGTLFLSIKPKPSAKLQHPKPLEWLLDFNAQK